MSQRGITDPTPPYTTPSFLQVWTTEWLHRELIQYSGLTDVRNLYLLARDFYYIYPRILTVEFWVAWNGPPWPPNPGDHPTPTPTGPESPSTTSSSPLV